MSTFLRWHYPDQVKGSKKRSIVPCLSNCSPSGSSFHFLFHYTMHTQRNNTGFSLLRRSTSPYPYELGHWDRSRQPSTAADSLPKVTRDECASLLRENKGQKHGQGHPPASCVADPSDRRIRPSAASTRVAQALEGRYHRGASSGCPGRQTTTRQYPRWRRPTPRDSDPQEGWGKSGLSTGPRPGRGRFW